MSGKKKVSVPRKRHATKEGVFDWMDRNFHPESRTIFLNNFENLDEDESDINAAYAAQFCKKMHYLEYLSREPITIKMYSYGGSITAGFAIHDLIKYSPCETTVIVNGASMSMGVAILQAAKHRIAMPTATIMTHPCRFSMYGEETETMKRIVKGNVRDQVLYKKILLDRTGLDKAAVNKLCDSTNYLDAGEALRLNLVDKIFTL